MQPSFTFLQPSAIIFCNHPPFFATIRHLLQPSACRFESFYHSISWKRQMPAALRLYFLYLLLCWLPLPACRFFCPKPCARPPHESSLPVTTARSLRQKSFTQRVLTSEIKCTARLRIILQQNIFFWTRKFCQAMFFFPSLLFCRRKGLSGA